MAEPIDFWEAVEEIRRDDDRFAPDAYAFVMDVLEFTIRGLDEKRHVSGRELLDGLCRYARERYGIMARTVMERWGLRTTDDVGAVVFHLVGAGVLARQPTDARADFEGVFDLYEALERDYFGDAPDTGRA